MTRVASIVVVSVFGLGTPAISQDVQQHFAFVLTDTVDANRFLLAVGACQQETRAFTDLILEIPVTHPLRTEVGSRLHSILFGSAYEPRTFQPLLSIDILDFGALPTPSEVRGWAVDSSWALTRCEMLAHEIREGVEYARLWAADTGAVFKDRLARAHAAAVQYEDLVAGAQRTRADAQGRAYSRTGFCNYPEQHQLQFFLGTHTETVVFAAGDRIAHVRYTAPRGTCPMAGRSRPN